MKSHGHTRGRRNTPTYSSYRKMLDRCYRATSDNYKFYGGRGITVCARWRESFENFLSDMGERPEGMTLDRVDPNGNYSKANCRWLSVREQSRNRRDTMGAETRALIRADRDAGLTLKAISERYGVPLSTVHAVTTGATWKD